MKSDIRDIDVVKLLQEIEITPETVSLAKKTCLRNSDSYEEFLYYLEVLDMDTFSEV